MPYWDPVQPQLLFKADKGIKTPLLPITDTYLLSNISDSNLDSDKQEDEHNFDIDFTPQRDIDIDPTSTSS